MRCRRLVVDATRAAVAGAVLVLPVVALAALLGMDGRRLELPGSPTPAEVATWWSGRPSVDAVAAVGRWVAVVALAGVAVSAGVTALHRLRPGPLSARLVRRVPRSLRLPLTALFAVTLAAAPAGASTDGGAAGAPAAGGDEVPTMWVVDPATSGAANPGTADHSLPPDRPISPGPAPPATGPPPTTDQPTDRPVAGGWVGAPPGGPSSPETAMVEAEGPATSAADATRVVEVVVRPGDHLWSLAAGMLERHLGRPASDAEVTPYWRLVVDSNADRLVAPGDPDLILPGQVLVLPPPPI